MPTLKVRRKWRPSLALVIGGVCSLLIALPLVGVMAVRLTSSQFVRETERSLQTQAAFFAEAYAQAFEAKAVGEVGIPLPELLKELRTEEFYPADIQLAGLRRPILPPRPDPKPTSDPLLAPYWQVGEQLSALAVRAQRRTLAGYIATDLTGRIIASSGPSAGSLAHVREIREALSGKDVSTLRYRSDQTDRHPLTSISRNTSYRVFVAQPVVVGERIVGTVMLSRTPVSLQRFLYQERGTLTRIAAIMVVGAFLTGLLFWRFISGPIRALSAQSQAVADRSKPMPEPLSHYGAREVAELGQSVLSMAKTLNDRSATIETYTAHVTHELKSPVTVIIGAAELLSAADGPRRDKLVRTIHEEGERMNTLLDRLRTLAKARLVESSGSVALSDILPGLRAAFPALGIELSAESGARLPVSDEQAVMILTHLLRNAEQGRGRTGNAGKARRHAPDPRRRRRDLAQQSGPRARAVLHHPP